MHAHSGYWSPESYLDQARKDLQKAQERAKDARRAHRGLPRAERLLTDLALTYAILARLKKVNTPRRLATFGGPSRLARKMTHQLRRWNRLVRELNKFNGASQQVAEEEIAVDVAYLVVKAKKEIPS